MVVVGGLGFKIERRDRMMMGWVDDISEELEDLLYMTQLRWIGIYFLFFWVLDFIHLNCTIDTTDLLAPKPQH